MPSVAARSSTRSNVSSGTDIAVFTPSSITGYNQYRHDGHRRGQRHPVQVADSGEEDGGRDGTGEGEPLRYPRHEQDPGHEHRGSGTLEPEEPPAGERGHVVHHGLGEVSGYRGTGGEHGDRRSPGQPADRDRVATTRLVPRVRGDLAGHRADREKGEPPPATQDDLRYGADERQGHEVGQHLVPAERLYQQRARRTPPLPVGQRHRVALECRYRAGHGVLDDRGHEREPGRDEGQYRQPGPGQYPRDRLGHRYSRAKRTHSSHRIQRQRPVHVGKERTTARGLPPQRVAEPERIDGQQYQIGGPREVPRSGL